MWIILCTTPVNKYLVFGLYKLLLCLFVHCSFLFIYPSIYILGFRFNPYISESMEAIISKDLKLFNARSAMTTIILELFWIVHNVLFRCILWVLWYDILIIHCFFHQVPNNRRNSVGWCCTGSNGTKILQKVVLASELAKSKVITM